MWRHKHGKQSSPRRALLPYLFCLLTFRSHVGPGLGVIVLKRLSDAVKNNDTIRAVIRSTGSNQDGHTPGITQPSKENQAKLIRSTYEKAGLDPSSTRYFEAHGKVPFEKPHLCHS